MRHIREKFVRADGSPASLPLLSADEWATIVDALRLTPRQTQVVQLIFQAKKDKQIAAALGVNIWTIRTHLTRTFEKLGVADRVELVLRVFGALREKRATDQSHKTVTQ